MLGLHCCASFSLVVMSRGYSLVAIHRLPVSLALPIAEHGLGFSSCDTWAQSLHGMWDLPGPGIEPCLLPWLTDALITAIKFFSWEILNVVQTKGWLGA